MAAGSMGNAHRMAPQEKETLVERPPQLTLGQAESGLKLHYRYISARKIYDAAVQVHMRLLENRIDNLTSVSDETLHQSMEVVADTNQSVMTTLRALTEHVIMHCKH